VLLFSKSSKAGNGKMPDVVPDFESPYVVPLMACITNFRRSDGFECQFNTTSDSGSDTGRARSRIESMKL
jgi:hypothetical protein